jgi:inorganic pyrophosphatase
MVYKQLEDKKVEILETGGHEEAEQTISNALELYKTYFLGEQ